MIAVSRVKLPVAMRRGRVTATSAPSPILSRALRRAARGRQESGSATPASCIQKSIRGRRGIQRKENEEEKDEEEKEKE